MTPVEIVLNIVDYHRGKYNCSVPFTGFFFKWNSIYFFPFLGNIVLISYFCSVIKTKNDIYILELKVDDTVDNALAQIDSKGYAIPYEADGCHLTKCGVTISSEARNITHWRAVDKDGKVIDEQKF